MLIPELPTPNEGAVPDTSGSLEEPRVEPGEMAVPADSPTVLRGSSSSARRRLPGAVSPLSPPVSLPVPGELVDTFLIEEAIGVGGMGAVFRALDTKLDRQVALKLLPPDQAGDTEIVPRFYQEGRSAAQLDHENIARVYSIGQDGAFHYIAFEYIEGVTVRQKVETSGALAVGEAVNIALQIAYALVHASMRGVVHRDIKPSNIIITPGGRAKLVDMGLARRFERGGDHGLTQSGMTLGTFDYISPEQARDPRDVDVRSDLYSLGCTLFHMLTGRPPFPGGTVLQKLIQHQEEAPADVRMLNSAVPVELAGIITRLMAKDRDRRYQTPEHLVRELLGIAGLVGLAPPPSPVTGWHEHAHRPAWEPHLVWLVPVVGFVMVVMALAWWGREPTPTLNSSPRASGPRGSELNVVAGPATSGSSASLVAGETRPAPASPVPAYPRNIPVSSNEDLLEVLATAPRRSVIVLSDDGPYRLGGRTWSSRSPAPLASPDLVIKAEPGVRPLIKFADEVSSTDHPLSSLLQFVGGHVTIEGLKFEMDAVLPEEMVTAIRTEDTELLLRGCSFRRTSSREGRNVAAIEVRSVRSSVAAGNRPPAVLADSCHFDGGQTGILAEGPVDVVLRDCTMGPGQPSIWFDNSRSSGPVFGELRLQHTSIMAGPAPVFRFDGTQVRVWVDDSVIAAPADRSAATLVMVDNSRNLTWRGRSNLYSGFGVYLAHAGQDDRVEQITDFARWGETPTELRETGTLVKQPPVWDAADPAQALLAETDNPTRVFLLSSTITSRSDIGASKGPFGSVLKNVRIARRSRQEDSLANPPIEPGTEPVARKVPEPTESNDVKIAVAERMPANPPPTADPDTTTAPDNLQPMPPMSTPASVEQSTTVASTVPAPATGATAVADQPAPTDSVAATREPVDAARTNRERRPPSDDEDVIRTASQFTSMLNRLGRQGGTLRIAAGADLDLPATTIDGSGRYQLVAVAGPKRPRLRFRAVEDLRRPSADWTVMLNLRSGSLHLQGIDVIAPDQEMLQTDRLAIAGLMPGTELTVTDCTLTLAANRPGAALFVVQPLSAGRNTQSAEGASSPSAVFRVRDSLLRSGGEGAVVATGRKVDIQLTNVLLSTEGSLVHAVGEVRSGRADSPSVKVRLDQVTALVKGGLVHLDATRNLDEPELPFAAIEADSSILSTANRDIPLLRLDSKDEAEDFTDRIHWAGRKVAYDRNQTYRRDEIHQNGVPPKIYDRANWSTAFLPTDESPILGDVKFLRETDPSQAAWKIDRDDFKLVPGSPLAETGPQLARIPAAPAEGDR
jgi:eukaryotic-like serine/threonine-protein kinase